jgi:hypothetical protein
MTLEITSSSDRREKIVPAVHDTPKLPLALVEEAATKFQLREPGTGLPVRDVAIETAARALRESRALGEQAAASFETITQDPSVPKAQALARAEKAVTALTGTIAKKIDAGIAAVDKAIADAQREMRMPVPSTPLDIAVAGQIRDRLAAMEPIQRHEAIMAAIAAGDDATIAAITTAPPFVIGSSAKEVGAWRDMALQRRHPEIFERVTRLGKVKSALERGGHATLGWRNRLFGESEAARVLRAAAQANKAAIAAAEASEAA